MISVIVPLWNPWEATKKLWASLGHQAVTYELIVIDGREGAQKARNRGAAQAKGDYLFFCDQDVELKPYCLELMLKSLIATPTAGYAYSDYDRKGAVTGQYKAQLFDATRLREHNYIDTCSLMHREVFRCFDETIERLQDWDLWLTLLHESIGGIYIPRTLFTKYYRDGDVSTRNDYEYWHEIVRQKHGLKQERV